ncbi:protein FD-like [Phoenix dactylifera]|uniref:Protein FD-like n=1 Tax=Phoenix dactylifera TaxID=42345 RepID=A0A8B7BL92_PHODC|nr:protein FD-like [Phoenix dactylifera]
MWSSENAKHNNKKKNKSGHGSSSRIVSSSSARSSPSSASSILSQTPRRRTMEEMWKDITLATLHQETPLAPLLETTHSHPQHHHHHQLQLHRPHPTASPSFRTMILQDFLSGPCSTVSPASAAAAEHITLPPSPPPLPPTALTLKSGLELRYPAGGGGGGGGASGGAGSGGGSLVVNAHSRSSSNSNESRVNGQANKNGHGGSFMPSYFSDAVISPPSPAGLFSFCSKKRMMPEGPVVDGDRRYKRMIKNRESAARSRARKQAYTNELELEVAHLLEENAKLKKQQEELRMAMADQLPNRNALQRSTSAPF